MEQNRTPLRIMIVAGEISGDMHAASILRELRRLSDRPIEAYGIGGNLLRAEGVELFAHADQTGVIGFWEVLKRIRFFSRLMRSMTRLLDARRPDILLTVDYPGFNMRLAEKAHAKGIRTVHYICPQVWVWHKERIPKIARIFDRLIAIFPFEPRLFDGTGLDARFAGHPCVDQMLATRNEPPCDFGWDAGRRIALFPGSRPNEIKRLLPDMLSAAALLERKIGQCSFIIPTPTDGTQRLVENGIASCGANVPRRLKVVRGSSRHALLQADAAVIKSGTSTLEATLAGCPCAIVYRVAAPTYFMLKHLVKGVRFIGLPNIIAGREICRELIQGKLTPQALADEIAPLVCDSPERARMKGEMEAVARALGEPGAARRAAQLVLEQRA